jgi:hypothetical protein
MADAVLGLGAGLAVLGLVRAAKAVFR